jgi:hypothetical protein
VASIRSLCLLFLLSCLTYHRFTTPVIVRIEGPEDQLGKVFESFLSAELIELGRIRIVTQDSGITSDYTILFAILARFPPGAIEEKGRVVLSVTLKRGDFIITIKNYDKKGKDLVTIVQRIGRQAAQDVIRAIMINPELPRPPASPHSDSGTGQPHR